jgi:formate--tetrahydrofolate ligase
LPNLLRHVRNLTGVFGLRCVVALNHRTHDTDAEVALLSSQLAALDTPVVVSKHWAQGGAGAVDLAHAVVEACESSRSLSFAYEDGLPLLEKLETVARRIYGATQVIADKKVRSRIEQLQAAGYGNLPICVAKTQSSFSGDPSLRGAPEGHSLTLREVRLAAGAGFVVMVCGDILTMPGLPARPAAHAISVTDDGRITGLS